MTVSTTPHVNFRGQAREALEFYRSLVGGEIQIATYADIPSIEEPDHANHVAFGRVDAPNGFSIMAYDVQPSKDYDPGTNPFYITLHGTEGGEIKRLWDALAKLSQRNPRPPRSRPLRLALRDAHRPMGSHLDHRRRHRPRQRLIVSARGRRSLAVDGPASASHETRCLTRRVQDGPSRVVAADFSPGAVLLTATRVSA